MELRLFATVPLASCTWFAVVVLGGPKQHEAPRDTEASVADAVHEIDGKGWEISRLGGCMGA